MKSGILAVSIFVAVIAILLAVLHFFKILALLALLIGFGVLVGAHTRGALLSPRREAEE
jgi:uncharacterized membrane protein YhaH (DUF805 family)